MTGVNSRSPTKTIAQQFILVEGAKHPELSHYGFQDTDALHKHMQNLLPMEHSFHFELPQESAGRKFTWLLESNLPLLEL